MRGSRSSATPSILVLMVVTLSLLAACATTTGGTAKRAHSGVASSTQAATATAPTTGSRTSGTIPVIPPVPPGAAQSTPIGSSTGTEPPSSPNVGSSPGPSATVESVQWIFTVVRHAERADSGTDDPPLTAAGKERANRLAERLAPQHGVAVYASPYQRAQATATPTSVTWGVPVTTYDPAQGAGSLLAQVVHEHPSGAILIVGHSDTVPDIVGVLCGCTVDPIAEDNFGNLYQITVGADGEVIDFQALPDY